MAITPSVPSADGDPGWATPARPGTMPVSALEATQEVAPGGQGIASPAGVPGTKADDVAASVAGAVAAAEARFHSHEADTHPQGSALGTVMDLPPVVADWSKHTGGSDATSFDPTG